MFSSSEKNQKTSLFWHHLFIWLVLVLFILKIGAVLFIFYFPKSVFFAEISKTLLVNLTNQERKSLGITSLRENSNLNQAAYLKAKDMLNNDYFAHTSPSGLTPWYWFDKTGYKYQYAGENLAIDFIDSEELFEAWDNSPSHRENIIDTNYTDIGIAVVSGEFKGSQTTVVVQLFGSPTRALAKEPTTTSKPKPSSSPVSRPTTSHRVVYTGPTLYQYFAEKGEKLPSLQGRAILYEEYGLGPASSYQGTIEQNATLLEALVKGEKIEKPSSKPIPTQPEPQEPTVVQEPKEEVKPKVAEKASPSEAIQREKNIFYKILDFVAKHYDNVIQNAFFVALALVIISLSFDFVGKIGINYSNLFLKGTFYTFVLLVLYILNKEVILQFAPRALKIF